MVFKDHFSRQSAAYSRYRPGYPPELIGHVAGLAPARTLAVDCATGSGQAAIALASHFERVLAVDGSVSQLANAAVHPAVQYVAALAEQLPLRERCAALVCAAQAIHWFDFRRFFVECRRVLMPGGVVAAWTYAKFRAGDELDRVVLDFYERVVGPWWPPERRYVEAGYRTLPFPLDEFAVPQYSMTTDWDLDQAMGYFASWSAVQRCRDATRTDPLPALRAALEPHWTGRRRLDWLLHLRVGRV